MFLRFLAVLVFSVCFTCGLLAQEPERKNTPLFYKITATWCGPCGSWGWDLANEVQEAKGDNILYMAIFNNSQATMNNTEFYNSTAVTLGFNFRYTSWPSFGVNGVNLSDKNQVNGVLNIEGIKQECLDSIEAFIQQEVLANAASAISIENDTLRVQTNVKFFEKGVGDYYLASYIIEQGALNYQNMHQGLVAHKGVLRGTLDSLDWGRRIVEDSIAADSMLSFSYDHALADVHWVFDSLVIYNVIWKREGSKYRYINGNQTRVTVPTDISGISDRPDLNVYPNPVQHSLEVKGIAIHQPLSYTVYELSGRVVLEGALSVQQAVIDVSGLANGMHIIRLEYEGGSAVNRKFIKW